MEDLPNELLSEILGFLHPVYDGLARFSTVCRRWNEIIHKTPSLWEHIHLKVVKLTEKEKRIVFRCLRDFDAFIKCLRVHGLDVVFGYDYWFFIRIVTLEMTNITCLDVPNFPWNLQQFLALRSAESLKELNLYGFWDLSDIEWTQTYHQPVSLINQGHLQLLKVRCAKLQVLKLSINMLRMPEKALMEFLNSVKLKELQISAYNSQAANIQMKRTGLKLLKCLLSSSHASIVSKLDLQYVSIGHKELRLLLKAHKSLRILKLRFHDVYRCMTGYQYLESKSLEYFELNSLPAKNIVNLKCSMPKLRYFRLSRCFSLKSLQIISSMLQQLYLDLLPSLRSLHITSTILKRVEVWDCESLTSKTIEKVLHSNKNIEHCTVKGNLLNFEFSPTDIRCSLAVLHLWISDICKVQRIEVHCPTLTSFVCIHQDPERGEFYFSPQEACCIDLRCNDLLDAFISLPRITSIDIKCRTIMQVGLNRIGRQNLDMHCSVLRIEAEKTLDNVDANKCIFNRVQINAEEIDNLDFKKCQIKGVLKLEGGCINVIRMENLEESQGNVDLIARCNEIRKVILRDCVSLFTVTIYPDEKHLFESSLQASTDFYFAHSNCNDQEAERKDICSDVKNMVKTVSTSNCPCFCSLVIFNDRPHPGTPAVIQDANAAFSSGQKSKVPKEKASSLLCNHCCYEENDRSLGLDDCEKCKEDKNEHSKASQGSLHDFHHEGKDAVSVEFSPLTGQGNNAHTGHTSFGISPTDEEFKKNLDTLPNVQNCKPYADLTARISSGDLVDCEEDHSYEMILTNTHLESPTNNANGKSKAI